MKKNTINTAFLSALAAANAIGICHKVSGKTFSFINGVFIPPQMTERVVVEGETYLVKVHPTPRGPRAEHVWAEGHVLPKDVFKPGTSDRLAARKAEDEELAELKAAREAALQELGVLELKDSTNTYGHRQVTVRLKDGYEIQPVWDFLRLAPAGEISTGPGELPDI